MTLPIDNHVDNHLDRRIDTRRARLADLALAAGYGDGEESPPRVASELVQLALVEGLGPLLGHRHKRGDIDVPDAADAARLLHTHRSCTARNVLVENALEPVMTALRERGVEAVVLKGAALVERVFRHPGCRSMGDVDLLVRRADWRSAREGIASAGARTIDDPQRRLTMRLYHEVHAALPGGGVLDLHRSLSAWPLFGVDHEAIFRDAEPTAWGALVPSVDHLFVCLAMHAAQDGFFVPFRGLVDGLALAHRHDLSPDAVGRLARRWKARRATALWLRALVPYGLPARFQTVLDELDPRRRAVRSARSIPRASADTLGARRWQTRWQLARALDGPVRPVAFFAYRGAAFAADLCLRLVPGT